RSAPASLVSNPSSGHAMRLHDPVTSRGPGPATSGLEPGGATLRVPVSARRPPSAVTCRRLVKDRPSGLWPCG
ncbi:MAG: hypothetical protein ACQESR_25390, partial [Planctomycetota bacterium]